MDLFNSLWNDLDVQLEEGKAVSSSVEPVSTNTSVLIFKEKQFWENTRRSELLLKGNLGAKNVAGIDLRKISEKLESRGPSQVDLLKVVDEECEENEERSAWSITGCSKSASELLQQLHAGLVCKGHTCQVGSSKSLKAPINLWLYDCFVGAFVLLFREQMSM